MPKYKISDKTLIEISKDIINNDISLRTAENKYNYSRSTIHYSIHNRLFYINYFIYYETIDVLKKHFKTKKSNKSI